MDSSGVVRDSQRGGRRIGIIGRIAIGILAALVLIIAAVCALIYDVFPPLKPSAAESARVETMLEDYAQQKWDGRVTLQRVEVALEQQGTDFPPHEYETWVYHAYFGIDGTEAVFFATLPKGLKSDEVANWCGMSSNLNDEEVALLVAYSEVSSAPALAWFTDGDSWIVTPADPDEPSSWGMTEYVFEDRDGSFVLVSPQ